MLKEFVKWKKSYLALPDFNWATSKSSINALKSFESFKIKAQTFFSDSAAMFCLQSATSRGCLRMFAKYRNVRRERDVRNSRRTECFVTFCLRNARPVYRIIYLRGWESTQSKTADLNSSKLVKTAPNIKLCEPAILGHENNRKRPLIAQRLQMAQNTDP